MKSKQIHTRMRMIGYFEAFLVTENIIKPGENIMVYSQEIVRYKTFFNWLFKIDKYQISFER